jgi:hypothetical protein
MKSVNFSLTVFILGVVVMEVLGELVVMAVLVVLVKIAVLVVLVMRAVVLDVLVVTGSSCITNMTTTPMRVPNATNTKDAIPIIMNFPHFTVQPASASLSSSSSS